VHATIQDIKFLTAKQVRARYGNVSRMWVTRRITNNDFPKPVKLGGRLNHWRLDELEAWDATRQQRQ
jgi:predicted DNA-binding transcriptional regulator AlpA